MPKARFCQKVRKTDILSDTHILNLVNDVQKQLKGSVDALK